MSELLTPHELSMFQNAPEDELVDLAIDLDVPVPAEIDLGGLLDAVVRNLADLAQREDWPVSLLTTKRTSRVSLSTNCAPSQS